MEMAKLYNELYNYIIKLYNYLLKFPKFPQFHGGIATAVRILLKFKII